MKLATLLFAVLSAAPAAEEPLKFEDPEVKPKMRVVTDGKGHYLAFDPTAYRAPIFYGDAKVMYLLRSSGGGKSGDAFYQSLWDPRIDRGLNGTATFEWKEENYIVQCPPKKTALQMLSIDEGKKILDAAELRQSKWLRRAHKLARDDKGSYYFVDCARDDNARGAGCARDWRLYLGQRGKMKLQQMTNIVHDTEGEIFATKSGELRLVLTEDEKSGNLAPRRDVGLRWITGKVVSPLVNVPVEMNARLIYTELGIYDRERLGTPCDDM